ncbi:MAG: flagellar biosynthesis anti-sigma factor FlgM [Treponema sp.]|jgi:negative regulator of flagellin synthesis FlgM|nr:flagellar biosynthesis anti-sigma factor FlgM [Treponema sp.]
MTIDRIGSIDSIQPERKPGRVGGAQGVPNADSISISAEAQVRAEQLRVRELVASAPDVRADRVAQLRERINDPAYLNDQIVNATADRLIGTLFG